MGVPTSEVSYTSATAGGGRPRSLRGIVVALEGKKTTFVWNVFHSKNKWARCVYWS